MIRFLICLSTVVLITVGAAQSLSAQPITLDQEQDKDRASHLIVVRLTPDVFRSGERERRQVNETTRVREVVLGTPAVGRADVQGKVAVDFFPDRNDAGLWLTFSGTSVARTVSQRQPTVIHSVVTSRFLVRKPIVFDLDRGFRYGEATSDVQVMCTQRTVQSTVGGLRGRVVRRVAHRRLSEMDAYLTAVAETNTERRINERFNREADRRLAALNTGFRVLRLALQQQASQAEEGAYDVTLNTTSRYLQIGVGPKGVPNPRLPDEGVSPTPIQVWLHASAFGEQAAPVVESWDLLQGVLPTPSNVSGLTTLLRLRQPDQARPVEFTTAAPWVVIGVGEGDQSTASRVRVDRRPL